MSELGELLELIHNAHARVSTFEAEYRDWINPRPSLELSLERSELGEAEIQWHGAGPFPKPHVATRRIWLRAPRCVRIEIEDDEQLVRLGVRDGSRWLRWDRVDGVTVGDIPGLSDGGRAGAPPLLAPPLIQPAQLLAALWFEPRGKDARAGRQILAARARPRHPLSSADGLGYDFEFDAEHGTILHRTTLDGGVPIRATEVLHVRYGHSIDPARFELVAPDGPASPVEGV